MKRRQFINSITRGAAWTLVGGVYVRSLQASHPAMMARQVKVPAGGGGGPTYLLQENFEGTGYELSWTEAAGTPDEDYATAPAPLAGSHSLRLDGTSVTQRADSPAFATTTDLWVYMLFNPTTLPGSGNNDFFHIRNSTTQVLAAQLNASGTVRVSVGNNSLSTVSTMSAGTTYHVWVHYIAGSGSNAFGSIAFSTDGTKPTSGNPYTEITTGTSTLGGDNLRLTATATNGGIFIMDKVRADDATIGDNPT
jgi:hypothetical protein